jgi:thioredoxin-dependent peroxiredoxin
VTKQNLPYTLLCDPSATLIDAIGFKKSPKGTQRGVFVVDKAGKVLIAEAGGPQATFDAVKTLVTSGGAGEKEATNGTAVKDGTIDGAVDGGSGDKEKADVAAEVANTAEKIDSNEAA